jgi:hypothetical protein
MSTAARTVNRRPPNAGKGRPKGSKNKLTASIKQAMTEAFERLGGVPSLVKWGRDNPTEFYRCWARLAPQEHTGPDDGPLTIRVMYDDPPEWRG